jgi:hypothetical protein
MSGRDLSCEYIRAAFEQLSGLYAESPLVARAIVFEKLIRAGSVCVGAERWSDALVDELRRATASLSAASLSLDLHQRTVDSLPDVPQELAAHPEMIGWCYQTWNAPARDLHSWAISRRAEDQAELADVGVLTQLFTDDYLADFLVDRCLSLLPRLSKVQSPGLTLCDPACGVGHVLLAALKKLSHGQGCPEWIGDTLFGFDIDPVAVAISRSLLFLQSIACGYLGDRGTLIQKFHRSIVTLTAPFGTLQRSAIGSMVRTSFDVVVTNPPYLGRRKLSSEMREFLDREYPATSVDLCAAFMQRCIELCAPQGALGLLTSDKWLRLRGYEALRSGCGDFKGVLGELSVDVVLELGARAFHPRVSLHDGVKATILCARKDSPQADHVFCYRNLASGGYEEKVSLLKQSMPRQDCAGFGTLIAQRDWLEAGTGKMLLGASDLPQRLVSTPVTVAHRAKVVVGVQTSNDARYVRYVWQIPGGQPGWRIHSKGGGYARWYGLNRWVIDWERGAKEFFKTDRARAVAEQWAGREGWSYTWFANGALGLRGKEAGWSFGRAAASGFFCEDNRVVAFLNSRFASVASQTIGGKVQLPEGVVRALPLPDTLAEISPELVSLARTIKWELTRSDLRDVSYEPLLTRDLHQELALEALVLVVEGILERQVERSLGVTTDVSEQWGEAHGCPVAWLSPSTDILSHPLWSSIPSDVFDCRAVLKAHADTMPEPGLKGVKDDPKVRLLEQESLSYPRRYVIPATGIVEHLSRVYQLHPFDVVSGILDGIEESSPTVKEICSSHLCVQVVREVLQNLGHRWWSVEAPSSHVNVSVLTQGDIASIVEQCAARQTHRGLLGLCIRTWIERVLIPWQSKRFLGASPLRFGETERGELWCAHMAYCEKGPESGLLLV